MLLLLLILLTLYILAIFGIAWFSLHPFRIPVFISPEAMGAAQDEVEFPTEDGLTLKGWWVPANDSNTVVVLAHGYMMNRCELTPLAVKLWQHGCSCLLFDFRAHGRSGGNKSGLGYVEREDIRSAVQFAREKQPGSKVVLIGSSMGAAAIALAMGDNPSVADGAILDSCYSRLPSAVLGWWRFVGGKLLSAFLSPTVLLAMPLAGFNPYKVDVADALTNVEPESVLIVHGDCDTLALPEEAKRNAKAAGNAEIVWLADCGHSEGRWIHSGLYYDAVLGYFRRRGLLAD
jgi:pimeloyl-ACP methyl ester carboxylesterase